MVAVTTRLIERAEEVFTDLGYTVSGSAPELRAERKWRVVEVRALDDATDLPESGDGDLHCFVASEHRANTLREEILDIAPEYDWAILSLADAGTRTGTATGTGLSYEVLHP